MGMGEPLHNYDDTMEALRILTDPHGLALSPKRDHLVHGRTGPGHRTAGDRRRSCRTSRFRCTRTTEDQRARWCRSNRSTASTRCSTRAGEFPLGQREPHHVRVRAARRRQRLGRRRAPAGEAAARILRQGQPHPAEPGRGIPYERPSDERVNEFGRILADLGITVSVRKSRGRDIRAACGQLIVEGTKKSAAQRLATLMR